jgi:hypothetical protein
LGSGYGFLPIRDMAPPLRHDAQHFAANIGGAGLAVGHDALGASKQWRRQGRSSPWAGRRSLVDTQTRPRNALDALDDRAPGVVFEANLQLGLPSVSERTREIVDVAFVLEHLAIATFSFEDGMATEVFRASCALRMRVSISAIGSVMLILDLLYQLALIMPGTSPRIASFAQLVAAQTELAEVRHAGVR